jgi:hypothetical protein
MDNKVVFEGTMDSAATAQPDEGMPADWASALPSMPTSIPSISDVGMLTVAKGYGLAQSRMGPWGEFASCSFSKPAGVIDAKNRMVQGFKKFLGNYALVTSLFACMFVLGHPTILVALVLLGGGWAYLLRRTEPVVLMGKELGEKQLYVLMGGVSVVLFMLLGAVEVVLNGVIWGVAGSSVHAILHETDASLVYDPLSQEVSSNLEMSGELTEISLDLEAGVSELDSSKTEDITAKF